MLSERLHESLGRVPIRMKWEDILACIAVVEAVEAFQAAERRLHETSQEYSSGPHVRGAMAAFEAAEARLLEVNLG